MAKVTGRGACRRDVVRVEMRGNVKVEMREGKC